MVRCGVERGALNLTCMRNAVWVGLRITPRSCRTPLRSDAATLQSSTVPGSPPDTQAPRVSVRVGQPISAVFVDKHWL